MEGAVEHSSDNIVVKASTQEIALLKYLTRCDFILFYFKFVCNFFFFKSSPRDTNAALNLGRVLADRCKKFGITNMIFQKSITFDKSIKEQTFYKALADNGINFF